MGPGPSKTTTTDSSTAPWAPQQPYLLNAFKDAQSAYDANKTEGAYNGDYVAPSSQAQYDAYGNAVTTGQMNQSAVQGNTQQGLNNVTAGSTNATTAGNNLASFAGSDITGSNIDAAKRYVAGLDIPGAVKAGMLSANQNAAENALPNIFRTAAASGGINSDRAALATGVVERGLAEQSAGLSAQLNNDAYKTGLSNAQQGNSQQLQADSQLGSLGLGVLNAGQAAINSGVTDQANINQQITGGANGATGLDQKTLDNLMAKYNGGQAFTQNQLQNLMAIIGKPLGTQASGSTTEKTSPSLLQNAGSAVGILGSLF